MKDTAIVCSGGVRQPLPLDECMEQSHMGVSVSKNKNTRLPNRQIMTELWKSCVPLHHVAVKPTKVN